MPSQELIIFSFTEFLTFVLKTGPGFGLFCLRFLILNPEINKDKYNLPNVTEMKCRCQFIHWSLFLTLGRTPVTPANRHRKNLGTKQIVWKFNVNVAESWSWLCQNKSSASGGYWLFSLAAVGVVHHHASAEACSHGLCCDKFQL